MVATAHATYCSYFIAHGDDSTYVYVHGKDKSDSRRTLVFRFLNSVINPKPLKIEWSDKSTLHISVPNVGAVTKRIVFWMA